MFIKKGEEKEKKRKKKDLYVYRYFVFQKSIAKTMML